MADATAAANRAYFNDLASSYDSKYERTITQLVAHIRNKRDFIGAAWIEEGEDDDESGEGHGPNGSSSEQRVVKLLDYACGTGLISRALAEFTTQCIGIDISEGMVATYNSRAENQGLSKEEMHAWQGNLADPEDRSPADLSSPEFFNFDIAVVGLGFHHFESPELAAERLVERLKPGGVFVVVDFLTHEPIVDGAQRAAVAQAVRHHGFSRERMQSIFTAAGAGENFAMEEMGSGIVFGSDGAGGHGHEHGHGNGNGNGNDHGHHDGHSHGPDQGHGNGGHGAGHSHAQGRRHVFIARGTKA